jgi:hypothetical protein
MNRYKVHLKDVARILFGQAPPVFLLEAFIRTLATYMLLIVRWLGKRMTGGLTLIEVKPLATSVNVRP